MRGAARSRHPSAATLPRRRSPTRARNTGWSPHQRTTWRPTAPACRPASLHLRGGGAAARPRPVQDDTGRSLEEGRGHDGRHFGEYSLGTRRRRTGQRPPRGAGVTGAARRVGTGPPGEDAGYAEGGAGGAGPSGPPGQPPGLSRGKAQIGYPRAWRRAKSVSRFGSAGVGRPADPRDLHRRVLQEGGALCSGGWVTSARMDGGDLTARVKDGRLTGCVSGQARRGAYPAHAAPGRPAPTPSRPYCTPPTTGTCCSPRSEAGRAPGA